MEERWIKTSDSLADVFTSWFFCMKLKLDRNNGIKYFMTSRSYFNAHEFHNIFMKVVDVKTDS